MSEAQAETSKEAQEPSENKEPEGAVAEVVDVEDEPSAEQQLADLKDRYVRLAADFDNYKKRFHRELEQRRRTDQNRMLSDWLEVLDTLERALEMSQASETDNSWREGTEATHRKMVDLLKKRGVVRMETTEGQTFDPKLHEAISVIPDPNKEDGTILFTERGGYVYADGTVLRAARVVVVRK